MRHNQTQEPLNQNIEPSLADASPKDKEFLLTSKMHETELYNGSFYPRQPVDHLEEEDELTTKREADIQNKISYIKGALEKLRSNFPVFNPVQLSTSVANQIQAQSESELMNSQNTQNNRVEAAQDQPLSQQKPKRSKMVSPSQMEEHKSRKIQGTQSLVGSYSTKNGIRLPDQRNLLTDNSQHNHLSLDPYQQSQKHRSSAKKETLKTATFDSQSSNDYYPSKPTPYSSVTSAPHSQTQFYTEVAEQQQASDTFKRRHRAPDNSRAHEKRHLDNSQRFPSQYPEQFADSQLSPGDHHIKRKQKRAETSYKEGRTRNKSKGHPALSVEKQLDADISSLLLAERKANAKLEHKLQKKEKLISMLKDVRAQLTQEMVNAQSSNQNLLMQIEGQKGAFEKHITRLNGQLEELAEDNSQLFAELKTIKASFKKQFAELNEETQRYQEINIDLANENEHLHRQLRADKKQFETLSRQKDEDLQTINNEKEKLFEKELDKSKVTMNKIIEESIKDKSTIEKLEQNVRQREKDLKRFKRKNAAQEQAIVDLEQELQEIQRQQQQSFNDEYQSADQRELYSYKKLLSDLMHCCQLQNYSQILPFVQEMQRTIKIQHAFVDKTRKLMMSVSHQDTYSRDCPPQPKEIWRWFRSIVEDFFQISQHVQMNGPTSTFKVTSMRFLLTYLKIQRNISLTDSANKKAVIQNVKGKAQADTFSSNGRGNTFDSQPVSTENDKILYTIRDQLQGASLGKDSPFIADETPEKKSQGDDEKKIENLKAENLYMEHILDKVREHFKLGEDKALIDIEIFLSRLSAKKSRAGLNK